MTNATEARRLWLGLLARAPEDRVAALLKEANLKPAYSFLRQPEIGTVMVRGRTGGTGAPFNLTEMTVSRASVQLDCGTVGHGHVSGRSKPDAEAAAVIDALMQTNAADNTKDAILNPLTEEEARRRKARAQKAAATKVEFFTMVRGDD